MGQVPAEGPAALKTRRGVRLELSVGGLPPPSARYSPVVGGSSTQESVGRGGRGGLHSPLPTPGDGHQLFSCLGGFFAGGSNPSMSGRRARPWGVTGQQPNNPYFLGWGVHFSRFWNPFWPHLLQFLETRAKNGPKQGSSPLPTVLGSAPCWSCSNMSACQAEVTTSNIVRLDVENPNITEPTHNETKMLEKWSNKCAGLQTISPKQTPQNKIRGLRRHPAVDKVTSRLPFCACFAPKGNPCSTDSGVNMQHRTLYLLRWPNTARTQVGHMRPAFAVFCTHRTYLLQMPNTQDHPGLRTQHWHSGGDAFCTCAPFDWAVPDS